MHTLQTFLATSIPKATADMEAALFRLPQDKRNWSAGGTARSAMDMAAEIAVLNGDVTEMIRTKSGTANFDLIELTRRKDALCEDWPLLKAMLDENTSRVVEAIRQVPDEDLGFEFQMPWGAMTMSQIISYPYWNACYHEGQINFIASLLGCLK